LLTASFDVGDELFALVGPSGCGKSVLLRAIAGIYAPDDGTIRCNGETLFNGVLGVNQPPTARRIGYVPQNFALFPHLTVAENIAFPLRRAHPGDAHEVDARVADMLELLRLHPLQRVHPPDIDESERVWVAIARALITDPDVLLLDETFSPLDQGLRQRARSAFVQLRRAIHVPAIVATGELSEACDIGDRVAVLDGGRVLQIDAPSALLAHPTDRQVARLVGATNVVPASVIESVDGWVTAETPIGELRFPGENPWGHELDIVLRPELLKIVGMSAGNRNNPPSEGVVIPATIVDELRHGADHVLYVRPDDSRTEETLEVRLTDLLYQQQGLAGQRRCWLVLPDEAIHAMPRHTAPAG